jgi:hypothetical protein
MLTFELPGLVMVTACVWVAPTDTLPKLMEAGFTVSCPLEPDPDLEASAGDVSATTSEKQKNEKQKKNERNLREIPLQSGPKFFTARPHNAEQKLRGRGIKKPLRLGPAFCYNAPPRFSNLSLRAIREQGQVTEGHQHLAVVLLINMAFRDVLVRRT